MKILTSEEYRALGEQITAENLQLLRELGQHEVANDLEVEKIAIEEHRKIESATGLKFNVVTEGANANVAAFVETDSNRNYVVRETLRSPFALHAAHHEQEHRLNGMFELPLNLIDKEDQQLLCEKLSIKELDETELIEGFNELSTFRKHGHNNNSGYAAKEVPLAEKLEDLALEHLHISLLDIFRSGQAEKFVISLQQLIIKLKLQEVLSEPLALAA